MDLIGSLFIFIALVILSYTLAQKKKNNRHQLKMPNSEEILSEELGRRKKIINKLDSFLKAAQFLEPIATWKKENIYRYIANGAYLYEFEDIMLENNQKIGIDEEHLCFKQLSYKRVAPIVEVVLDESDMALMLNK